MGRNFHSHIVGQLPPDPDHGRGTEPDPSSPLWHQAEGTTYDSECPKLLPGIRATCRPHCAFQSYFLLRCSRFPGRGRLPKASSARQATSASRPCSEGASQKDPSSVSSLEAGEARGVANWYPAPSYDNIFIEDCVKTIWLAAPLQNPHFWASSSVQQSPLQRRQRCVGFGHQCGDSSALGNRTVGPGGWQRLASALHMASPPTAKMGVSAHLPRGGSEAPPAASET